jgi:hypothetical protein
VKPNQFIKLQFKPNNNLFIKTQQNAHENNNNFQGNSLNTNNNSLNFKIENIL